MPELSLTTVELIERLRYGSDDFITSMALRREAASALERLASPTGEVTAEDIRTVTDRLRVSHGLSPLDRPIGEAENASPPQAPESGAEAVAWLHPSHIRRLQSGQSVYEVPVWAQPPDNEVTYVALFTRPPQADARLREALESIVKHHGSYINDLPGEYGVSDLVRARAALAATSGEGQGK